MTSPVPVIHHTHLHFYQCSWCKNTATSPYRDRAYPPKCASCLRFMKRLWSEPITTDEQQALARRGLVFNPGVTHDGPIKRLCDECKAPYVKELGIDLGVGGQYCSAGCADIGTEKHRAAMEGIHERLEKLYEDQPWLRPASTQK